MDLIRAENTYEACKEYIRVRIFSDFLTPEHQKLMGEWYKNLTMENARDTYYQAIDLFNEDRKLTLRATGSNMMYWSGVAMVASIVIYKATENHTHRHWLIESINTYSIGGGFVGGFMFLVGLMTYGDVQF